MLANSINFAKSFQANTFLGMLAVYAIFFAVNASIQFASPHILDIDGYYHIKSALLIRTQGFLHSFPWAQLSTWRDHYFDKELLFHVMLIPFTYGDLEAGAKWAAVALGSLFFPTLYWVLRREGLGFRLFFLLVPLSSGIGHYLFRLQFPRGQIISGSFVLLCLYFLFARRTRSLTVTVFLFTLSYGSAFITIGFAALFVLLNSILAQPKGWNLLAATIAAFLLASLIHPNFPNNFEFLYTQMVQVLLHGAATHPGLQLAGELRAYYYDRWHELLWRFPLWTLALCACAFCDIKFTNKLWMLFLICLCFFALAFRYSRFIEYFVPVEAYFLALFYSQIYRDKQFVFAPWRNNSRYSERWRKSIAGLSFFLIAGLATLGYVVQREGIKLRAADMGVKPVADWLEGNTPPQTAVFTCDFMDTHPLFFYNDKNYYTVAADPIFLYNYDPALFDKVYQAVNGKNENLHSFFINTVKMNWGVCRTGYQAFLNQIRNNEHFAIRYEDSRRVLFQVLP